MSLLDAHHAPYNKKHCYWTGLLLMAQCTVFITSIINTTDDIVLKNLYATSIVLQLLIILKIFAKVYKAFWLGVLELIFLVNLSLLSGTLSYLRDR